MSLWSRIYERINWKDEPIEETPLSARNLNKMDAALYEIDGRVVELSGYESVVIDYSNQAKTSAQNAKFSEDNASASASSAKTDSDLARSYTVGTHGEVRENDDTDNAKYYYEQTKSFVTGSVTGIKGEAEEEFRDGNVIITKGNLGLENVENKSAQEIISEIGNATESSDGLMSKEDKVNLDGISDHVSNLSALTNNIIGSDEYNPNKSYVVGEMCIRNNQAYECILPCQGIEPPNTTYWKEVSLSVLNNKLNKISSHVGMIIHSTTLDTMAKVIAIYGGTKWVKIEGRFLLGQSSSYAINSTGGAATHTLTINEMPSHNHAIDFSLSTGDNGNMPLGGDTQGMVSDNISSVGGGKAHNNMPPYKTVYIWERTA